jgi:hypothetical protein
MTRHRQRHARKGASARDPFGKIMAPWTFSIMFPCGTQFIFRSLMFTAGEDGNLELLTQGPVPKHLVPVYGKTPHYPANSSTSGGACSGMNPYAEPYYLTAMTSQEILIEVTISESLAGTSSSSLGVSPDRDSTEDYPEIGGNFYWNPVEEGCLFSMVALAPSGNNSSRYPHHRKIRSM